MQKQKVKAKKPLENAHLHAEAVRKTAKKKQRLIEAKKPLEDGSLISEAELVAEKRKLQSAIMVPLEITLPPMHVPTLEAKKARMTRLQKIRATVMAMVLAFIEWLSPRQKKRLLTKKGELALAQLRELAAVYQASSAIEGMDIVQFEALFGEAYYQIMQESKRHRAQKTSFTSEDYASFIEHFARNASGIT